MSATGHELPVVVSTDQPFERLLLSGTCRTAYAHNSDKAVIRVSLKQTLNV